MPIKVNLVRQTIPEAEQSKDSTLYVMNRSNPRGNINFVVRDSTGRTVGIQIPITFIPIDLSAFAVKEDILRTPDFRRLVNNRGFIHIIESASAEELLKDPKADAEFRRINQTLEDDTDLAFQSPIEESVNAEPPKTDDDIGQFIQNVVLRTANEPVSGLINELEGKLDTLSVAEVKYLKDNSTNSKIRSWCNDALSIISD